MQNVQQSVVIGKTELSVVSGNPLRSIPETTDNILTAFREIRGAEFPKQLISLFWFPRACVGNAQTKVWTPNDSELCLLLIFVQLF
jgi:hypothetical protein